MTTSIPGHALISVVRYRFFSVGACALSKCLVVRQRLNYLNRVQYVHTLIQCFDPLVCPSNEI
jgi:hypothetical protein